jgi:uncharacterized protein YqkB
MFQTKFVEKIKIVFQNVLKKSLHLRYDVEKCGGAREAAGNSMAALCMLD